MYQEIEMIDCPTTEPDTEPDTDRTLTAKALAEILGITERTVFKYANRILEAWHWLPESEFRANGIYTQKALDQMQRLKDIGNASEYAQQVARENHKPQQATTKTTAAIVPHRQTEALETKLATIQKNTTALNISVQDRILAIKERIATEASRTKNNQSVLDELEAQQAIARGIEKGLKIFELQEQAAAATVEQLTLEKLQQLG
ncbi:hypothetical protein H6G33_37485 [Calothrix sp. FACHB-1219]|uniref:hypothetical protein n=1 Tax=unclassified Calothrix TaxID=2619626 RepID=UPI0016884D0F|nr:MULTISPECIES: hypothetical protein [unclassified Calothrix]MBD2208084.1 hypothetical protein [Calothrix sp. FACHB-168]MBD2222622.1 hypothetical protein [Calothrix sp. FACHB-1219]